MRTMLLSVHLVSSARMKVVSVLVSVSVYTRSLDLPPPPDPPRSSTDCPLQYSLSICQLECSQRCQPIRGEQLCTNHSSPAPPAPR